MEWKSERASEVREKRTTTRRTTKGRRPRRTPHNKEQRGACARRAPRRMRKSERERETGRASGRAGEGELGCLICERGGAGRRARRLNGDLDRARFAVRAPHAESCRIPPIPVRVRLSFSVWQEASFFEDVSHGSVCRGQVSTENWADIEKSEDRSADRLDVRKEGQGWLHSVHGGVTTHWDR